MNRKVVLKKMESYLKAIIKELGYRVVKPLLPSTCFVYLVWEENTLLTVKIGTKIDERTAFDDWTYEHIQREAAVLGRVKGINGIAHKKSVRVLEKEVSTSPVVVLVKEYIEGKTLRNNYDCKGQPIPLSSRSKQKLCDLVGEIHDAGIAELDIYARNIVIDPAGSPFLIDLGTGKFKEETPEKSFQSLVSADLTCLEWLLKGRLF